MSDSRNRYIHIRISRRRLVWTLAAALVAGLSIGLLADTMTMTTYYPSPTGIYQRFVTTAQTILARDGGNVGIGTTAPQGKLDVSSKASGFLPPRMATWERDRISAPKDGMVIHNTDLDRLDVYSKGKWRAPVDTIRCFKLGGCGGQGPGITKHFAAQDCGGVLPDETYVGVLGGFHPCNGFIAATLLNAPSPGIWWYAAAGRACDWYPGAGYYVDAVYIKQ